MLTLQDRDIRYRNLRDAMRREGLDAMLVICDAQIEKKGLLKYLTNTVQSGRSFPVGRYTEAAGPQSGAARLGKEAVLD